MSSSKPAERSRESASFPSTGRERLRLIPNPGRRNLCPDCDKVLPAIDSPAFGVSLGIRCPVFLLKGYHPEPRARQLEPRLFPDRHRHSRSCHRLPLLSAIRPATGRTPCLSV